MKKTLFNIGLVCAAALLMTSCCFRSRCVSSGKTIVVNRHTDNFSSINIEFPCKVHFLQGATTSVKVKGTEGLVKKVETSVNGGTLTISGKGGHNWNLFSFDEGNVDVYITSPELSEVNITGSGDFVSKRPIKSSQLTLSVTGSGDILISNVTCDALRSEIIGSGDVEINGLTCQTANYSITGSGDITAKQNNVAQTSVSISGSGDMDISGENCGSVTGEISGSGDIYLKGQFKPVNVQVSGSGGLHQK